jgi:hypothetical protein
MNLLLSEKFQSDKEIKDAILSIKRLAKRISSSPRLSREFIKKINKVLDKSTK